MSDEIHRTSQEDGLKKAIRQAFDSKTGETIPEFDATWSAAEVRYRTSKRRYRIMTGVAASAVLFAIVLNMQFSPPSPELLEFDLDAALMTSTQWHAPSDVLMPELRFDFYQDVPELIPSTDFTKGLLL